jgi:[acyl-carrier-protein] S-malonyltransferase
MLKKIKTAAGFSLGEYSALVFGGGMSFEDGLKVVKARAEAMDAAAKAAKSGMASIGGISDDKLQDALTQAEKEIGTGKAYIANYMFPEGRTCSGDLKVLEKACEIVTKMGAKNAKMLNVSGAFHTPYMEAAGAALAKVLDEADVKMPTIKVYSNVSGKVYTSVDEIKSLLKRQLLEPVKWEQGTKDLITGGHSQYVEPGPGKQLKAMMRRIDQDAWSKMITLEK